MKKRKEDEENHLLRMPNDVSLFGPDVVCLWLIAVSHHSTEKDVKKHELFEKKNAKMMEKNHLGAH